MCWPLSASGGLASAVSRTLGPIQLRRKLEPGDVLVVARLDRLARSTRDLLNVLATIGERGAGFRSLKDTWADTTTPQARAGRCVGRSKARQAGTLDTRPTQCAGHYRRAGGWLPQSQGHLGRYNYAASSSRAMCWS